MPIRVALSLLPAACAAADGIETERVIGPEAPGKYKHPAAIAELAGGDLYIVYHGGTGEYADDTAVWGLRRRAGAASWEAPRPIADTPLHGDGNAVVWQEPGGAVWLFYVVRYGPTWCYWMIVV
jgi:predicted neuraminidase